MIAVRTPPGRGGKFRGNMPPIRTNGEALLTRVPRPVDKAVKYSKSTVVQKPRSRNVAEGNTTLYNRPHNLVCTEMTAACACISEWEYLIGGISTPHASTSAVVFGGCSKVCNRYKLGLSYDRSPIFSTYLQRVTTAEIGHSFPSRSQPSGITQMIGFQTPSGPQAGPKVFRYTCVGIRSRRVFWASLSAV